MVKTKNRAVSIIVPCIDLNVSENLPYPKELAKIDEDLSIIDSSFQHIAACGEEPRVVVILGSNKSEVRRYLQGKYNKKFNLNFVSCESEKSGMGKAIRATKHLLSDKNIILSPTAIMEYGEKRTSLIGEIVAMLESEPFVFVSKEETSVTRLSSSNALCVEKGRVVECENSPRNPAGKYNALWVASGFKKEIFDEVVAVFEKSNKKIFQKSHLYKAQVVAVSGYTDISTWTNLNAYLLKQYLRQSGVDPQLLTS